METLCPSFEIVLLKFIIDVDKCRRTKCMSSETMHMMRQESE